jgi:hypothetical protein
MENVRKVTPIITLKGVSKVKSFVTRASDSRTEEILLNFLSKFLG